jgi:hypothetical protein
MKPNAGTAAYTPPQIEDYGSLTELTADFDLNFVGSVAKTLTFAVASFPMPGGGGGGDDGGVATTNPEPVGGTPGPGDPGPQPGVDPVDLPDEGSEPRDPGGDGGRRGEREDNPGRGTLGEVESGGGIPAEGPTGAGGPGGGSDTGGGGLPFTGYAAWVAAAAGAAMTTAGYTLRQMLKRGD